MQIQLFQLMYTLENLSLSYYELSYDYLHLYYLYF